jgi:hypothetical protein
VTASAPPRSTRDLLAIGQQWQRRTRKRVKPVVRITQIHRADRTVEVLSDDGGRFQVEFSELRARYRLIGAEDGSARA